MIEKLKLWFFRTAFNWWPSYRGTGARITYISPEMDEIHTRIKLTWRTRNYVGTLFGGSMFAMADPIYMVILIRHLGNDYVVWDKSASIRFIRPGTGRVRGIFRVGPEEIARIKAEVDLDKERDYTYVTELINEEGKVVAEVEKLLYIARKDFYKDKRKRKKAAQAA